MEKLTSLAALRVGDLEKVQKLEAELEKAATHRHSYEEKGRKYRDTVEEVRSVPPEGQGPPSCFCRVGKCCLCFSKTGLHSTEKGTQRTGL